jgi:outer membrane receptor protein involved in Fe transport
VNTLCRQGRAAVFAALCLLAFGAPAAPQDELEFDIPAGPLGATLLEIARRAERIVSFQPALVERYSAPAIRGRLTVQQALGLATGSSGLVFSITPAGAVTVAAAPPAPPTPPAAPPTPRAPSAAPARPAVVATPAAVAGAASEPLLPRVEIFGLPPQSDGLRPVRGWSAMRSDAPLAEIPQAISVLTEDALALQGGSTVTDAVRYVPGVTASIDNTGSGGLILPALLVRGLPASYALSGLRSLRGSLPLDLAFVERIEVSKGPGGVLGGVADFRGRGGVVNLVLKEADPVPRTVFSQSLGSQNSGTVRLSADLGAPAGDRAAWRLVGYGDLSGRTEGGYTRQASSGLLGATSYRSGDFKAALSLQSERRRDTPAAAARGGFIEVGDGFAEVPVEPGQIEPRDAGDRVFSSSHTAQLKLQWALLPRWRMTLAGMAEQLSADLRRHQPFTVPLLRTNNTWNGSLQWSVNAEVDTGPLNHKLLLGLDLDRSRFVIDGIELGDPAGTVSLDVREHKQALVLQDLVQAGPVRLRVSVQRARMPQHEETLRFAPGSENGAVDAFRAEPLLATNWDAGLLYQLRPALSVYAGTQYSIEADLRSSGETLADGSAPPPTLLRQVQVGLKGELPGGRLSWTTEAFRLRETDVRFYALGVAGAGRSVDGVELELAGRPAERLDLNLGWAYLRAVDTPLGPYGFVVVPAGGVPRRSLHLLARYHLQDADGPGSTLGLALHATSSTLVGAANFAPSQVVLPGGAQVDVSWRRSAGPWTFNAALRNVFDRSLYGTASDTRYIPLLPGRSVSLTAVYNL